MDIEGAIAAFAALSQETRLRVFRMLVEVGLDGMPAGDIARDLSVPHNTLSTHLSVLARAGLVSSRRDGRSIIYAAHFEGARSLIAFLLQDCCGGRPELCTPLLDAALGPVATSCCSPNTEV